MNKKFLMTLAFALTIGVLAAGAGSYAVGKARAQEETSNLPPVIQTLIDRFNLNKDEVQQVVDEQRNVRHQEREAEFLSRLDQMVSDGKITEEQKNEWIDHHNQMQQWMAEDGFGRRGEWGGMHHGMMWDDGDE